MHGMDTVKERLRGQARALGFDLFGVAPAADFPFVPGWARSVLVLGLAALQRELLEFPTSHTRFQCAACSAACPVGKRLPACFWGLDPR